MEKLCSNITKAALLILIIFAMDSFLILGTFNYVPAFFSWGMAILIAVAFGATVIKVIAKKFRSYKKR